jgi:SAM-dependent methyltransferase
MPFAERMRENGELLRSYRRTTSSSSAFEQMLSDVARYDELLARYVGKSLSEARVFEIGYGARPYRLRAVHAAGADVYGVDAEVPLLAHNPSEYLTILRRNGWERLAKTLVRHALFDRQREKMFAEMLAQRGLQVPAIEPHRFLVGDAADCQPPGPFDLIISFAVFEHIERDSLERLVARMATWLVPDGIAVIVPDVFTGFHGGHLVEWEPSTFDLPVQRRSEPWEHLRKRRYRANTTLNELTRSEYKELFSEYFDILEIIDGPRGRQAEFLTQEIRAELADYSDEDLLDENPLFVLRPRSDASGSDASAVANPPHL